MDEKQWRWRWYHTVGLPIFVLWWARPGASSRHWFVWGITLTLVHSALILFFFIAADSLDAATRALFLRYWALIGGVITWTQVKSVGERPPGAEKWDKTDNWTSYIPTASLFIVVAIWIAVWFIHSVHGWWDLVSVVHFEFHWGYPPVLRVSIEFLPHTWGEIWPAFFASIFFALCDAGLIDVQYLVSRGLQRVGTGDQK